MSVKRTKKKQKRMKKREAVDDGGREAGEDEEKGSSIIMERGKKGRIERKMHGRKDTTRAQQTAAANT